MTRKSRRTSRAVLAVACSFGLVAAACGSDDDSSSDDATTDTEAAAPDDTEAATDTEAEATDDTAAGDESTTDTAEASTDEPADDADTPTGEATGEPIVIGVQNPEGDPAGSFPEASAGIQAAANYVNAVLGGLGGRPIEIELCKSVISPDDSQRCANELAASGVDMVISTINFFGNFYPIYQGSEIPVVVTSPVTIADFTTEGAYAIGSGCLGAHTGLAEFATNQIEEFEDITVEKVGIPWADTPPGVVCYNDLEAKPIDVINGSEPGDSVRAGERPDLTYLGVPILPAAPDVTPQATEVLDFDPDVIIFSAQGADCWNLVDALGRVGWTPDDVPLVMSPSCIDFEAMTAAGALAEGIYIEGSPGGLLADPSEIEGEHLENVETYLAKAPEYGMSEDDLSKGFGASGFAAVMNIWQAANTVDGDVTGQTIAEAFAATDGSMPTFGGAPLNCSAAPDPYVAVCASEVSIEQWDGEKLVSIIPTLSGIDLVAGTELRPG
ncbi:ABC transporter substrate-binding protein [Ilumatobacter sp.]|uniref:ABC transporter substrate-binding protein n=1 Tax=Ilumatobacter sp. TaxID=1967498 RepID=UPI003C3F1FA7